MGLILERIENDMTISTAKFAQDILKASRKGYVLTVIVSSNIMLNIINPRDFWPIDKNKIQVMDDEKKVWDVVGSSMVSAGDIEKIIIENIKRVACQPK